MLECDENLDISEFDKEKKIPVKKTSLDSILSKNIDLVSNIN